MTNVSRGLIIDVIACGVVDIFDFFEVAVAASASATCDCSSCVEMWN